jgi:hypothetical protein
LITSIYSNVRILPAYHYDPLISAPIGLCKLLCSKEGILVNGVAINKSLIAGWLERMTGHNWSDESIHALLNPKDPQDVPRAIKPLCLVAEMKMAVDSTKLTPGELKTYRALCLLGEMFDALVEPFINPTLSLSEQLIHLVKFAHLICAMFIKHESAFISNQLYGDLQCMVKNAIFKIAHLKLLNPHLKVFLCLLGDDVLETLFGRSRMIGGHSPNMAIDEFRQRVGSALRMDEIFRKYPWLERCARRLRMVRSRDVDHLSPDAWEGELSAGSCDIHACYKTGVAQAVATLESYGCSIDFEAHFTPEDVDLMRPKGGKYPGVSKEVDRSMVDDSGPVEADTDAPQSEVQEILNFDAAAELSTEQPPVILNWRLSRKPTRFGSSLTATRERWRIRRRSYGPSWILHSISTMPKAMTGFSEFDITPSAGIIGTESLPKSMATSMTNICSSCMGYLRR